MRRGAVLVLLALAIPAAGSDPRERLKAAFKPLRLPAPAKLEKELEPRLPQGIVIESGPFDALIARVLEPYRDRMREREEALRAMEGYTGADAPRLVRDALQVLAKELDDLGKRIAALEKAYAEVFDRDSMQASASEKRTRQTAAILIPAYRTLHRHAETLAAAAAEALRGGEVAALAAAARTDPLPGLRAAAADALGRAGGAEAQAALREVLRNDRNPLVRMRALGALLSWKAGEVADAIFPALEDGAWNVRALAVEACARAGLGEAVGPLVAALKREDGRLRRDVDAALSRITKQQFLGDAGLWERWWADNRARLEGEAFAAARERVLGPPRTWDREAGEDEEKERKGETSAFYGIPTASKRIVYVVDISRSMESAAEAKPAAPTRQKTDYPAPKGTSKLDIAKWQLHRAVEDLPEDAVFNIVAYSESYAVWAEEMTPAKRSALKKAHRFIDDLKANGVTNISDPLDKAFALAGLDPLAETGKAPELLADTIYLLSDGDPNRGRVADLQRLLDDVAARNPPGLLVIHTVGIGEAAGSSFLKELARRHGGRYVEYR